MIRGSIHQKRTSLCFCPPCLKATGILCKKYLSSLGRPLAEDIHLSDLRIPFASPKHAMIAKQVIEVDAELQPHAVKRTLSVEDNILIA